MQTEQIKVGTAGWSYPEWRGIVYPDGKTDMLAYVAQFVDVIEINSTFYRPALSSDSKGWLLRTEQYRGFFFTAKLHQDFTHNGIFSDTFITRFKDGLKPLLEAGKLKQLLAQFSSRLSDSAASRNRIEKIVEVFSNYCPLALELRHSSWQRPNAIEFLKQLSVSICDSDYYNAPYEAQTQRYIGEQAYYRMYGRKGQQRASFLENEQTDFYKSHELEKILTKIEERAQSCRSCLLIAVNHQKGAELANAIQLKAMISGVRQRFPEGLLVQYPELIEYAENAILF